MALVKKILNEFGFICAGWTLLAVLLTLSNALYRITVGSPPRFLATLRFSLLDYWIWALLTPVIFLLAKRFPFTRESCVAVTGIHFCFYLALTLTHSVLAQIVGLPSGAPQSFHGSILWLRFVSSLYDNLWMYWPAVVIWSLFHYYRRYREREKRAAELKDQLNRAELQALRNQLHPHFLFNTLNSVASLMHEDVQAADDMVGDLSHLLRVYLSANDEQEVRLRQEIHLLDTYIRIQKRRFEGRLSSLLDVPVELLDAAVPSLLLQPIVENSIVHGIAPCPSAGYVKVSVSRNGSMLNLQVVDNGLGLQNNHSEGIGLSNTRSRLRQLYDDRHSFEISNREGCGVAVRISLPLRFFPAMAPDDHTNHDRGRRTASPTADRIVAQGR